MPDWVHVWFWLRFLRGESLLTPLPQQGINPEAMSMAEYDELEREWTKAGAPMTTQSQVVAVLTGGPLTDDIPF